MPRFWTSYWREPNWKWNEEGEELWLSGNDGFKRSGIGPGDWLYVVSRAKDGRLLLGGKMQVADFASRRDVLNDSRAGGRDRAVASEVWVLGVPGTGTPFRQRRSVSNELSSQLRFVSKSSSSPKFKDGKLDEQTLRNVRELSQESAHLLDEIIAATDGLPRDRADVVVTRDFLAKARHTKTSAGWPFPEESLEGKYAEGAMSQILVNRYERDSRARQECLAAYGTICFACGADLGLLYGDAGVGTIHVHHLVPVSQIPEGYKIDPVEHLRPLCPNCHCVVHKQNPPYSIEELKSFLNRRASSRVARRSTTRV